MTIRNGDFGPDLTALMDLHLAIASFLQYWGLDEGEARVHGAVGWLVDEMAALPQPCDCECDDCEEEPPTLAEPFPGLTDHQRMLLDLLTEPRTTAELTAATGWRSATVGVVAASLVRRSLAGNAAGLWHR